MDLTSKIKQKALDLGFDLVGVTSAAPIDRSDIEYMEQWLSDGCAGDMGYMHRNLEKRVNPEKLLEGARSVVCVALNYRPDQDTPAFGDDSKVKVANFALYEDYHGFIKDKLRVLAEYINENTGTDNRYKICVDSVPLAERALAQRAGIGFIGKNRMLINHQFGLQLLLGEIITTVELDADKPCTDTCASCDRCIQTCPANALSSAGKLNAAKCVSYLTIEHKGELDQRQARSIGSSLFGCDKCIKVCPHDIHVKEKICTNSNFKFYQKRQHLNAEDVISWSKEEFKENFGDSSVDRLGIEKLKRNAEICQENLADGTGTS